MARITEIDETDVDVQTTVSTGLTELLRGARRVTITVDYGWEVEE